MNNFMVPVAHSDSLEYHVSDKNVSIVLILCDMFVESFDGALHSKNQHKT